MTIIRMIAGLVVGLALIVATNFVCDPGARVTVTNVNLAGVRDPNVAWEIKPFLVRKYPHDAIMIGSSRIFYVDPQDVPGYRFYDAGQAYMTPQRIELYLSRIACGVKLVVIGYDFDMFTIKPWVDPVVDPAGRKPDPLADPYNKPLLRAFPEPCTAPSFVQRAKNAADVVVTNLSYLVSGDTLAKSLSRVVGTLTDGTDARPVIHPAGNMDLTDALAGQSRGPDPYALNADASAKQLRRYDLRGFVYLRDWLADVKATRDLLAARHIRTVVIITPINELVLKRLADAELLGELAQFRSDLCQIFPQTVDLSESTYSGFRHFFAWDPLHFLPATGAEIIEGAIRGKFPRCSKVKIGNR